MYIELQNVRSAINVFRPKRTEIVTSEKGERHKPVPRLVSFPLLNILLRSMLSLPFLQLVAF